MRLALVLSLFLSTPLAAQRGLERTVAVTFDDVPGVALSDWTTSAVIALNQRLLAAIKRNKMPAAALVVTGPRRGGGTELTRIVNMWLDEGHEVGSHTHMHRDLNNTPLHVYLREVDLAHNR